MLGMPKEPTVPCGLCGTPTTMLNTKRCDSCWELETRIQRAPDLAAHILAEMDRERASHVCAHPAEYCPICSEIAP